MENKRIAVGMSGGVDSSLAALLLQEQGYEVVGVTLQMLPGPDDEETLSKARSVASQLGVPHVVGDAREAFARQVLGRCWEQYRAAETPNPCVLCNRSVKFGWLLDYARELGCAGVATGHYVRLERVDNVSRLRRGADLNKDQSYFLCDLTDTQRAQALFPLGAFSKPEVRAMAASRGLSTASASDSQDICFDLHSPAMDEWLSSRFGAMESAGVLLDDAGRQVASHLGTMRYTIGQRKGLGVALGAPAFVRAIDPKSHAVHLTTDPERLLSSHAMVRDCNWHGGEPLEPIACLVQTRYRQTPIEALVTPLPGERARIDFASPVRAVSPGQWAVFYEGDLVRGGGILEREPS